MSQHQATPGEARKIAAHAREHLPCDTCGAGPGSACAGSGTFVCKSRFVAALTELSRLARAARQSPGEAAGHAALLASLPRVPREEIETCRTERGGYTFTREKLASWGVPWPPPAGWRRALERGQDEAR